MVRFLASPTSTIKATILATGLLIAPVGFAQDAAEPDGRYQIEKDGDGFLRLDRKTGETSYCRKMNDNLICSLAIEERDSFHDEISELQSKLQIAQDKLDAKDDETQELARPKDGVPDTDHDEFAGEERDKIEKEIDKAVDITKFAMRKLFNVVKELQKEYGE